MAPATTVSAVAVAIALLAVHGPPAVDALTPGRLRDEVRSSLRHASKMIHQEIAGHGSRARRQSEADPCNGPGLACDDSKMDKSSSVRFYQTMPAACMACVCEKTMHPRLAKCASTCKSVYAALQTAAIKSPDEMADVIAGSSDHMPSCALKKLAQAAEPEAELKISKAFVQEPILNMYEAIFKAEEVGCPFGKRDCRADTECQSSELCVGGKCLDRCTTRFSSNNDRNCDPCTETCTAGYCQKIAGEVDAFELGFDLFKAAVDAYNQPDPANSGKRCIETSQAVFTDTANIVSGTASLPVGVCSKQVLFHPDDAPEFNARVPSSAYMTQGPSYDKGRAACEAECRGDQRCAAYAHGPAVENEGEYTCKFFENSDGIDDDDDAPRNRNWQGTECPDGFEGDIPMSEYQPNGNGECTEELFTHTLSVSATGDACRPVTSRAADSFATMLARAGVDSDVVMVKRYAKAKCANGKLDFTFSPNSDCSSTPGGFEAGYCKAAGNAFDASSCCVSSIIQVSTCMERHKAELHTKLLGRMEAACNKPGNAGVCPAQSSLLTTCLEATKAVKKDLSIAVDAEQAEVWAGLSDAEKKQAVAKLFGAKSDAVQKVSVVSGSLVINLEADSKSIGAMEGKMRNTANLASASDSASVGTEITKSDGTTVTVGVSAAATKSAAGPETHSGAPSLAASAAVVAAAVVTAMAL